MTITELLKKHGKKKLMDIAKKKKKNMSLRVDWEKGLIN